MSLEKMYIVWICAAVLFGIFESLTAQLVSVWFVIGAVAALVSSLAGAEFYVQIIVFIAVSVLMLLITRPLVKKLIVKSEPTNADRCIGKTATVTEDIDNINATGQVKVDGQIWTARSINSSIIKKGTNVTVEKIDGVKLIVKED